MKFILVAILAGLLAGCASAPTEYGQGCRDGFAQARGWNETQEPFSYEKRYQEAVCDDLERMRQNDRRIRGLENRR